MRLDVSPHRGEATTRAFLAAVEAAAPGSDAAFAIVPGSDGSSMTVEGADGVLAVGYSRSADLRAENVSVSLAGTALTVVAGTETADARLAPIGERHVPAALAAMAVGTASGLTLSEAAAAVASVAAAEPRSLEVVASAPGATLIDDGYDTTALSTTEALKTLAEIAARPVRSIAVLGELDFPEGTDPQEQREQHHRIGLLVVRLNIDRLIVVGQSARHIHVAAGLEGSWDGESVLVETAERAYDLLNETELHEPREEVVVLVKLAASATPLGASALAQSIGRVTA